MPRTKQQTEQIRTESREKILSTARRLFADQGYDGCNVADIAREAGMSQGNIYWYFPSKKEIYMAVLAEGFQALGAIMEQAAVEPGTALEKLNSFLTNFLSSRKEPGAAEFVSIVVALMVQGGVQRFSEFGFSTYEIGASYHHSLDAIFAQGQAEGIFRPGLDPHQQATFFFSFINGLMLMYPDEWTDIPDKDIKQALLRLVGLIAV